ncbi:hypothetical protein E4U60_004871 [Claviceps pazoutovae]|uniref:tRNA (adenine(58)-N(1))-methyltransferase catalytic subunit TRM61 n=1 Tax=Claviceps pazoutovae TaxID=1649127 RepID=A0A9P7M8P8_9HYPO|nr:hypothetical protein E4U60_004871 [Claviceps pazoutovae]
MPPNTRFGNRHTFQILRRAFSSNQKIQEHDVLLLRQRGTKYPKWHLTAPLRSSSTVKLSYGASLEAADLIGKNLLDVVTDSKGNRVVLQEPTLSSYIVNSDGRLATPIYPHDANTIVSLLDLHPSRSSEEDCKDEQGDTAPVFEIFEAGTGMGSLTLHLARAIHAANPPLPASLRHDICEATIRRPDDPSPTRLNLDPAAEEAFDQYKASRRAVLHTLDNKPRHSQAAYKLIRNFRRAQYLPSIDFHVGSIDEYLSERLAKSGGRPFLSRAILDLPSAQDNASRVVEALLPNGILIVFKPSISQIGEFQKWYTVNKIPLRLEKVLELPVSTTSDGVHDAGGGRHWDVKTVSTRVSQGEEGKLVQVMRPKVGERIAGGGFVAILRRWPNVDEASANATEPSQGDVDAVADEGAVEDLAADAKADEQLR